AVTRTLPTTSHPSATPSHQDFTALPLHHALPILPSSPRTKTSRRPSAFRATVGSLATETPRSAAQSDQPVVPFGRFCHLCQSEPSVPRTKTSRRPSRFWLTAMLPSKPPPSETHVDQGWAELPV